MTRRVRVYLIIAVTIFISASGGESRPYCKGSEHNKGRWVKYENVSALKKSFHCCQYEGLDYRHDLVACNNPLWHESLSFYDKYLVTGFNDYPTYAGEHSCHCDANEGRYTVNPRETYYWRPDNCDLLPWNVTRFCEILGTRHVLLVGDSTMAQTYATLTNMVQAGNGSCNSQLMFGRSNYVVFGLKGGHNLHEWAQVSRLPDIIIINVSAHLHDLGDMWDIQRRLKQSLETLRNMYSAVNRTVDLYWKTSNPAHLNCTYLHEPFAPEILNANQIDQSKDKYGWRMFQDFDEMAINASSTFNYSIIDVSPLRLRPDGHNSVYWHDDCLHYCIPGPLDIFSTVFLHTLWQQHYE